MVEPLENLEELPIAPASGLSAQLSAAEYRVRSCEMDTTITAGLDITAMEVAMLAVERSEPKILGILIEVSGGNYTGPNVTYVMAETVCRKLGCFGDA